MAINFPNDPATNPGDGGTWVDGDGNTWTVEIVSGEAIWTMTAAADTGGGGGGVTSVNGENGDVSLGIQDMNDYALNPQVTGYPYTGTTSYSSDGQCNFDQRTDLGWTQIYINNNDNNANSTFVDYLRSNLTVNNQSVTVDVTIQVEGLHAEPLPLTVYWQANYSTSVLIRYAYGVGNNGSAGFEGENPENWNDGTTNITWGIPGDLVPLAEGDVLTWKDGIQKFTPSQPAGAGSPLDGLLSVDGDAVKYGTAPTLGVDATDVVIPTMGQVRAAIASNGGTSVSLNDLTDVSYSNGSFEPTALDQVLFSSTDVPSNSTWKFYVNPTYGLNFAAYNTSDVKGSFIAAHEDKGLQFRTHNNLPINFGGSTGSVTNEPELRFWSGDAFASTPTGNYIGFKMPAGVSSNVTWTLPAVDGAASSVLTSDGAGNLTFEPIPEVTIPSTTYVVGFESTTSYKFTGPGLDGTELNPTLYFIRGQKYIFSNTLGAHPFQLQTVPGLSESPYTDGVTGTQPIDLGSFEWEVPMDAPSTIYYQCTVHADMAGEIKVLDNSGSGAAAVTYAWSTENGLDGTASNPGEWSYTAGAFRIANTDSFGQDFRAVIEASDETPQFWVSDDGSTWTAVAEGDAGLALNNPDWVFSNYASTGAFDPSTFSGTVYISLTNPVVGGSVDSVNSQTGVVSLGIQDMNDYAPNAEPDIPSPDETGLWNTRLINHTKDGDGNFTFPGDGEWRCTYDPIDGETAIQFGLADSNADTISESEWLALANKHLIFQVDGVTYGPVLITSTAINTNLRLVQWQTVDLDVTAQAWCEEGDQGDAPPAVTTESRPLLASIGDPDPDATAPLEQGDALVWSASASKFKPTQLSTVATSGDYNDLINVPSAGDAPVTSVNTETGDVSLGIQDMNDFGLAPDTTNASEYSTFVNDGTLLENNPGAVQYGATARFGSTKPDGSDWSAALQAAAGNTVWYTVDSDPTVYSVTAGSWGSSWGGYLNVNVLEGAPTQPSLITLYLTEPGAGVPLAEGDFLQWNDAAGQFRPAQLDYSQINNTPAAPARITPSVTTAALAIDATETGEITGTGATGFLISCQTNTAAWVRLYCSPDAMTADASRDVDTDPAPGSGVLFEALYSTFTEKPITPGTTYFNLSGLDKLYYRITNKSAIADTPITVTFKLLPME